MGDVWLVMLVMTLGATVQWIWWSLIVQPVFDAIRLDLHAMRTAVKEATDAVENLLAEADAEADSDQDDSYWISIYPNGKAHDHE